VTAIPGHALRAARIARRETQATRLLRMHESGELSAREGKLSTEAIMSSGEGVTGDSPTS